MATSVYKTVDIELMDGSTLKCRPLKISLLREFMNKFGELPAVADDNDKSLDVLVGCVAVAIKQFDSKNATVEYVEDNLDLPMIYSVIEAASGIKLGTDESGNAQATEIPGTI